MTPADLLKAHLCTPRCLLADPVRKCRCSCNGQHHGLLLAVDVTALVDGRRRFRNLTDLEVIAS